MATQLAVVETSETSPNAIFQLEQRQAKMFAISPLVPDALRGGSETQAVANCYIAIKLADIMGEAPLVVMQNIHIVKGKAGFSAQYMIARANRSGLFSGQIGWDVDRSDSANLSVTASATLKETGEVVSFTCDMKMAAAEGWTSNPKYKSMPELMLRYRSATFLVRLYCPEVMLGYQTHEEILDVTGAAPDVDGGRISVANLLEQSHSPSPENNIPPIVEAEENGRADADHGDQHDGTASAPAWQAKVDDWLARLGSDDLFAPEIKVIETAFLKDRAALPDDIVHAVEVAIAGARKRVGGVAS